MKYLYKIAGWEAVNLVNYYRGIVKQADSNDFMSAIKEYKNPLIGAGIGMGLGYLLSSENKKLLGTLGGGLLGGLGGYGYDKLFNQPLKWRAKYNEPKLGEHIFEVNIPSRAVTLLNNIDPEILKDMDANLRVHPMFRGTSDEHGWSLNPDIFMTLSPEQQLSLIQSGSFNRMPQDTEFYNQVIVAGGSDNIARQASRIANIGAGLPQYAFLRNPLFYKDKMDALKALMSKYNLYRYDIGNSYSDTWRKAKKEFEALGNGYSMRPGL